MMGLAQNGADGMGRRWALLALTMACACLLVFAAAAQAETIDVTTTADPAGVGNCPTECSLRQAVAAAKPGDTVVLKGEVYALSQGAQVVIDKSLKIEGELDEGIAASGIEGAGNLNESKVNERMFKVTPGSTVEFEDVQLIGGIDADDEVFKTCSPCETLKANGGGAIYQEGGTLRLTDVDFLADGLASSASPLGGAVSTRAGTLEMHNVTFSFDGATFGGALFFRAGTLVGEDVSFEDDGLVFNSSGGAVYLAGGTATLTNTTVVNSGTPSTFGGGVVNGGAALTLLNDTLSGNIRGALETDAGASTTVKNTILASGFADGDFDCVGEGKGNDAGGTTAKAITVDAGANIDQDDVCGLSQPNDKPGADPKLVGIGLNTGFVPTQALLHESAAIDTGSDEGCPANDARDVARPKGAHCDIGAFEAVLLGQPTAETSPPLVDGPTAAFVTGTIDLAGEAGGYSFRWGTSPGELVHETSEVAAGVLSEPTLKGSVIAELIPSTKYFYTVTAANASGSALAGNVESFTTEAEPSGGGGGGNNGESPPSVPNPFVGPVPGGGVLGATTKKLKIEDLPPPVLGKTVDIEPVSGTVLVALPEGAAASAAGLRGRAHASLSKGLRFIPLSEARQIPVGSTLDTTRGVAKLATASATAGQLQFGNFGAGLFKLLQSRAQKGLTELDLMNTHTPKQVCSTVGKRASAAKHLSGKVLGQLNVDSKGKFTARGQYSASTVRGTVWSVSNQCNGTLTKVVRGVVSVRDLRKRKTVTLFTGQSYLAKAPGA
jgi:hypothetical protein